MPEDKVNYSKLGLKAGLEIHQQLDTRKLFCNCPSILRKDEPDYTIYRKLHAVAGESGEVDVAAKYEASLGKEFVYQGYNDNVCLIDLDEEPPHQINFEALKIALQISLLLNCNIFPITQIMRKTVIDGSNTSGFQRTLMIARDGWIETSSGKIGIQSICLEEDSARPGILSEENSLEDEGKTRIWKLDRLGIPLIEIATSPELKIPEQIKEAALKIGEILRSCKVKRGLGTIRQDLNISIKGHDRVEIKGFQDPDLMIKTVDLEIKRQLEDISKGKKKGEVRGALEDGTTKFNRPLPGADRMYPETDLPLLKISREFINDVKKTLPSLRQDIEKELKEKGLNQEMAKLILKNRKINEFNELVAILDNPSLISKMLLIFPKEIASHEGIEIERVEERLNMEVLAFILEKIKEKKLNESQIKEVIKRVLNGTRVQDAVVFKKHDKHEIEETIMKMIKEKPGLNINAYMGLAMKELELSGKLTGKEIMDIIQKFIK
ncbi:MAG: Glu-tRNA(Gln) amidotransferase subunit GatE [Nanoarchaeota archaeon]